MEELIKLQELNNYLTMALTEYKKRGKKLYNKRSRNGCNKLYCKNREANFS